MEEEQKESEGAETPKEKNLTEEASSTEASAETPQIQPENPKEETPTETPKEEASPETQLEVEESQIETQAIPQETLPTSPQPQPEIPTQPEPSRLRQLWQKALEKIKERKSKKLEKILQLAKEKGEITNDDVEKLLHVSDRAASRYLNELVRQGRLKRIGPPSHAKYQLP
jgi:predicted HTH transcriptional regulator